MRPIGWIGVVLIVAGAVVLLMRGVSYTKDRQEMQVGPIKVASEQKGFVPPIYGWIAVAAGVALVFAGRASRT